MSMIHDKWGQEVIEEYGYLALPNFLLYSLSEFDISSTEALILIFLLSYWWDKEEVFPSSASISKRLGVTVRTVDRSLGVLAEKRLITNMGKKPNRHGSTVRHFDLSPVRDRLNDLLEQKKLFSD